MMRFLTVAWMFFRLSLRSLVSSRVDYYLGTLSLLVMQASSLIFLYVAFQHKTALAGYGKGEIWLFFGLSFTIQAVIHCVGEGLWLIGPKYVVAGNLDYLVIRPWSTLCQVVLGHLHSSGVVNLFFGVVLIFMSLQELEISLNPLTFTALFFQVFLGSIIGFSLLLIIASLSFYFHRVTALLQVFTALQQFLSYPLDLFPSVVLAAFTFVLPAAFIAYFPLLHFLDANNGGLVMVFFGMGQQAVVAGVCLAMGLMAWRMGIRTYQGSF